MKFLLVILTLIVIYSSLRAEDNVVAGKLLANENADTTVFSQWKNRTVYIVYG